MRYDVNPVMKALREADGDAQQTEVTSVFDAADPLADASPRVIALSQLLDVDPVSIEDGDSAYEYTIAYGEHEGETYRVFTEDERDKTLHDNMLNLLFDIGLDGLNIDVRDYVDDAYCENTMEEYIDEDVHEMSDDDIIDWLLENGIVELSDPAWFRLRDDVDADDDDFDKYDASNYECVKRRWELEDACASTKKNDDLVDMFWNYGYGDDIAEDIKYYCRNNHGEFPGYFDVDKLVDDLVDECDPGQELAYQDGVESLEDVDGVDYYIYRID